MTSIDRNPCKAASRDAGRKANSVYLDHAAVAPLRSQRPMHFSNWL